MGELDFAGLRADVADAIRQPAFAEVEQRVRRTRLRQRVTVGAAVLATLAALTPAILFATGIWVTRSTPLLQDGRPQSTTRSNAPDEPPVKTVELRAVAGTSIDDLYGAVDACTYQDDTKYCSLQVTKLDTRGGGPPLAVDLLRQEPTDDIGESGVGLVQLSERSLLLTGSVGTRGPMYVKVNIDGSTAPVDIPNKVLGLLPGDPAVQLKPEGELYAVCQSDGRFSLLRRQPPVGKPVLATGVPARNGWWVTGTDPATGGPAIAVSHDLGASWVVRPLGLQPTQTPIVPPTVVTSDGRTAYLFGNTGGKIIESRTTDGGRSWRRLDPDMPWPAELKDLGSLFGSAFGAVLRLDGSLLVWIEDGPTTTYLESVDRGVTFRVTEGPEATRVVAVPGGYVAFADPPRLSRDGLNWKEVTRIQYGYPDLPDR